MSFTYPDGNAVLASGGTRSAPAIRIRGATNTGIYSERANELSFGINGIPRMVIFGDTITYYGDVSLNRYKEIIKAIGNSGSSQTLTLTSVVGGKIPATIQTCTLSANCTFTMPATDAGRSFTLMLKTGTGGFTASFVGAKWPSGVAPTVTSSSAGSRCTLPQRFRLTTSL